jgi:hypothetical protein
LRIILERAGTLVSELTIRFVGGPWHNRLECVEITSRVVVRRPVVETSFSYAGCFPKGSVKEDTYFLANYETRDGTPYMQYVHSSLVRGKWADESTYRERFPKWVLDRRKFEAALRKAMK